MRILHIVVLIAVCGSFHLLPKSLHAQQSKQVEQSAKAASGLLRLQATQQLTAKFSEIRTIKAEEFEKLVSAALAETPPQEWMLTPDVCKAILKERKVSRAIEIVLERRMVQEILNCTSDAKLQQELLGEMHAAFKRSLVQLATSAVDPGAADVDYARARENVATVFVDRARKRLLDDLPQSLKQEVSLEPELKPVRSLPEAIHGVDQQLKQYIDTKAAVLPEIQDLSIVQARELVNGARSDSKRIRSALESLRAEAGDHEQLQETLERRIADELDDLLKEADVRKVSPVLVKFAASKDFLTVRKTTATAWRDKIFADRLKDAVKGTTLPAGDLRKKIDEALRLDARAHHDPKVSRGLLYDVEENFVEQCRLKVLKSVAGAAQPKLQATLKEWLEENFLGSKERKKGLADVWGEFRKQSGKKIDELLKDCRDRLAAEQSDEFAPLLAKGEWAPSESLFNVDPDQINQDWLLSQQELWAMRPVTSELLLAETWEKLGTEARQAVGRGVKALTAQHELVLELADEVLKEQPAQTKSSVKKLVDQLEKDVTRRWQGRDRKKLGLPSGIYDDLFPSTLKLINGMFEPVSRPSGPGNPEASSPTTVGGPNSAAGQKTSAGHTTSQPDEAKVPEKGAPVDEAIAQGRDETKSEGGPDTSHGGRLVGTTPGGGNSSGDGNGGGEQISSAGILEKLQQQLSEFARNPILQVIAIAALILTLIVIAVYVYLNFRHNQTKDEIAQFLARLGPVDQQIQWLELVVDYAEKSRPDALSKFRRLLKSRFHATPFDAVT